MIGIGIDTGGTYTDAVAYDINSRKVLCSGKARTTHDRLEKGIRNAIKTIDPSLIEQASYISLSTTLSTNACVENKGGRVCLFYIGIDEKTLERTGADYGFSDMECMRFIDGDPVGGREPDWAAVKKMLPEVTKNYDAIAVSQINARRNSGAYEKKLKELVLELRDMPVVCAYEIFTDLNAVKRGAGAYLNARLIPVIDEFFKAVKTVLSEEKIDLPLVIMRSDGSLVSEEYSRRFPVETLLCGPTASAKGAKELFAPEENAVIVDMGGTTTDIALIKNFEPLIDKSGVRVGKWQTFVKGIYIDTFALGGDTIVTYKSGQLQLGSRRAEPLSMLAGKYPGVVDAIRECTEEMRGSTMQYYEHFYIAEPDKYLKNESRYTEEERTFCDALKDGPRSVRQLASILKIDPRRFKTARLEDEGILMKSAFTPTDCMVLRGDIQASENGMDAAALAGTFIADSIKIPRGKIEERLSELTGRVYYLVRERLYKNIVRVLWQDSNGREPDNDELDSLNRMTEKSFKMEYTGETESFFHVAFSTNAKLLGVGAPTHIFIEDTAKALRTSGACSNHSGVANAVGALIGDVCVYESVYIKPCYNMGKFGEEEPVYQIEGIEERFKSEEDALKEAEELSIQLARDKAFECGAGDIYDESISVKRSVGTTGDGDIYLGSEVTACAKGHLKV